MKMVNFSFKHEWPLQAVWSKSVIVSRNRILKIFEKFIYRWPKRFADSFWVNYGLTEEFIGRSFRILRAANPVDQDLCGFDQGQSSVVNLYFVLKRLLCKLCDDSSMWNIDSPGMVRLWPTVWLGIPRHTRAISTYITDHEKEISNV